MDLRVHLRPPVVEIDGNISSIALVSPACLMTKSIPDGWTSAPLLVCPCQQQQLCWRVACSKRASSNIH